MPGRKGLEIVKHLNVISLTVPLGIVTLSVMLPLRPVIQQAFVGVLLIWFGVEAMLGFPVWR